MHYTLYRYSIRIFVKSTLVVETNGPVFWRWFDHRFPRGDRGKVLFERYVFMSHFWNWFINFPR